MLIRVIRSFFFFFNDTATTEIYTLSLHDALPISACCSPRCPSSTASSARRAPASRPWNSCFPTPIDRKSTRLNSSHSQISYAVFCLKKKKNTIKEDSRKNDVYRDKRTVHAPTI